MLHYRFVLETEQHNRTTGSEFTASAAIRRQKWAQSARQVNNNNTNTYDCIQMMCPDASVTYVYCFVLTIRNVEQVIVSGMAKPHSMSTLEAKELKGMWTIRDSSMNPCPSCLWEHTTWACAHALHNTGKVIDAGCTSTTPNSNPEEYPHLSHRRWPLWPCRTPPTRSCGPGGRSTSSCLTPTSPAPQPTPSPCRRHMTF